MVPYDQLVAGPLRPAQAHPPTYLAGGFEHRCNSCHRLFRSRPSTSPLLTQHTEIDLKHGMNNRCFNCHDRKDREALVLERGTLGAFSQTTELCARCHGLAYRDWQKGTHGKTLGSWQEGANRRRLICTECHDPHAPAYPLIPPLPAPDTLRMGDQHLGGQDSAQDRSPLRFRPGPRSEKTHGE